MSVYVPKYRVCYNTSPHCGEWWTVEKSRRGLFRREVWYTVDQTLWAGSYILTFKSEDAALAWIEEDRRPANHTCREVA